MTNPACTFHDLNGHAGTRYAAVATSTGGLVQSICAADFGPLLTTIASSIGGITRLLGRMGEVEETLGTPAIVHAR